MVTDFWEKKPRAVAERCCNNIFPEMQRGALLAGTPWRAGRPPMLLLGLAERCHKNILPGKQREVLPSGTPGGQDGLGIFGPRVLGPKKMPRSHRERTGLSFQAGECSHYALLRESDYPRQPLDRPLLASFLRGLI